MDNWIPIAKIKGVKDSMLDTLSSIRRADTEDLLDIKQKLNHILSQGSRINRLRESPLTASNMLSSSIKKK